MTPTKQTKAEKPAPEEATPAVEEQLEEDITKVMVPVVLVFSKAFAGKSINVPLAEQSGVAGNRPYGPAGNRISFSDAGHAEVNPAQAEYILNDSSYRPFIFEQDRYEKEIILKSGAEVKA